MKKFIDIFLNTLIFFIIYFLQSNFFTWFDIAGVMPNLFVILIMIIGLFMKNKLGFVCGIIYGVLLDFFIGGKIGVNGIAFGVVGLCAEILDKNFSKDNRITVMFLTSILTILAEIIIYSLKIFFCGASLELLGFIKILTMEIFFNAILMAVIYPFILAFGNKLENDFTNNSFLKY